MLIDRSVNDGIFCVGDEHKEDIHSDTFILPLDSKKNINVFTRAISRFEVA